ADHADEVVRVRLPMHQKFTAAQRTELASWKSLLELEAAHTEFCDEDASVLVGLEGLQRLDLFASRVTSKSISSLVQLRSLQYLSIGATRVSMKDLTGLSHLPIEELNLVGRNLDEVDAIHSLSQLPRLHTLQVVQCSQSQLQQVVQLKSLRELRLFPLPLDPTAFSTLGRLPKLECLRLSVGAPVSTLDFTELSSLQIIEIRLEFSPATLPELKLAESTKVLSFFGPIVGLDEFVAQHPNLTVWHNASRYQTP
ncbi:MAG: hypothetical protein AB8G99_00660, partial [Planctomycetaceae bacterium]